jgi:hypothetical protein
MLLYDDPMAIDLIASMNILHPHPYCASDILTCTPALVFVVGALDEI